MLTNGISLCFLTSSSNLMILMIGLVIVQVYGRANYWTANDVSSWTATVVARSGILMNANLKTVIDLETNTAIVIPSLRSYGLCCHALGGLMPRETLEISA